MPFANGNRARAVIQLLFADLPAVAMAGADFEIIPAAHAVFFSVLGRVRRVKQMGRFGEAERCPPKLGKQVAGMPGKAENHRPNGR